MRGAMRGQKVIELSLASAWGSADAFRLRGKLSVVSRIARSFASSLILVGVLCRRPDKISLACGRAVFGTGTPRYSTPFKYNPWTEKENEISRSGRRPSLPVTLVGVSCLLLRALRVCTWHVRHTSTMPLHDACMLSKSNL